MLIFAHTNKLKIMEIDNANTDPTKNHQYNVAMPPLGTQPSSPHSPLTKNFVAKAESPPHPHVEAGEAAVLAWGGGSWVSASKDPKTQSLGSTSIGCIKILEAI